jgi:hypothetical protein
MSIQHLLPNSTSGTAGHYENTSGDSWLYVGATEQTIYQLLLGKAEQLIRQWPR